MLDEKLVAMLNDQINLEFYSSNLYLQMSSWCELKALEGCAGFLKAHADEEISHMHRLFRYVNDTGSMAVLGAIQAPPSDYGSIDELFQATYEHERHVTEKINQLAHAAFSQQDFSTFNFLQWYVAEQHEEEKLFKTILDKVELVGTTGSALFFFDREIAELAKAAQASGEAPA